MVFKAEGVEAAEYLNNIGVAVFVLKYRLGREAGSPYRIDTHALQDGQRAMRLVRSRADEWGLDPTRIGMLGFSAGGEVVSMVSYAAGEGDPDSSDPIERVSAKPNFQMLVYPGRLGIPETIPVDAPPAFLLVANDDFGASQSITRLIPKMRSAGVPMEVHIYARGGHAFNMGNRSDLTTLKSWPDRMHDWMKDNFIFDTTGRDEYLAEVNAQHERMEKFQQRMRGVKQSFVNAQTIEFKYQHAPIDNPLKGLVPYWHQHGPFPCSMEFWYFPIGDLMVGPKEFDWSSVEEKLENIRSRGNQMVIRTYLEYPGKESAMPKFLLEKGVKIIEYKNDDGINRTPDYHNPKLISAMEDFIAAFGKKYDGDPRIGFITMGVLGHWGEWHTYPKEKLFATKEEQTKIQDAFAASFKQTKILMRYPAGNDAWAHAANDQIPVGYHDDSFAWATLATGKDEDDWYFEPALKAAGEKALNKWKTEAIGGEIRPEIWGGVFDQPSTAPQGQEFDKCVSRLHVTWLMDSGMFAYADPPPTKERIAAATNQVQKMGYELFVKSASIENSNQQIALTLQLENKGVAPFYYDWNIEIVELDESGKEIGVHKTDWKLTKTLPDSPITWSAKFSVAPETQTYAIRVINPMQGGKPLRFANETQRDDGLLILK